MLNIIGCISKEYDLGLVVMAAPLCFFACFTAMSMIGRARAASGNLRRSWIAASGLLTGCGVWATHFVWMLAYKSSLAVGFDIPLVVLSALVAIVLSGIGYWLALNKLPFGGALAMSAAMGGMHYTGMLALQLQADAIWNEGYVAASVVIG